MTQLHLISMSIRISVPADKTMLDVLKAMAALTRPFKVFEEDTKETELTQSYASDVIGEENMAVLSIRNVLDVKPAKGATTKERKEFEAVKEDALTNLLYRGVNLNGKVYLPLATTPSQKKQAKVTMVTKEYVNAVLESLGITRAMLVGTAYAKCEDKLIPNTLSGQTIGSVGRAGFGMKNVFVLADKADGTFWLHQTFMPYIQEQTVVGSLKGKVHAGMLTNKVGDANGMVIRELMPAYQSAFTRIAYTLDMSAAKAMWLGDVVEAIRIAYMNGTIYEINERIHEEAREGRVDLYFVEQSRGKGMKCTLTDVPFVLWCFELGICEFDGMFGVKSLQDIVDEKLAVIVTTDCLKAKDLWKNDWAGWVAKGYERIRCCDNGHISCKRGALENRVSTSRQHLMSIIGASQESIEGMVSHDKKALEEIVNEGSKETRFLKKLFGDNIENSYLSKALDTTALVDARNVAESCAVTVPGFWSMCIWELKPMLAVAAHLDDESEREDLISQARQLGGQTIAVASKAKEKVGAWGRYPTLNKNFLFVRIVVLQDYCDNALVLGWDLAANDIAKADTDGDHLVTYTCESNEEREVVMQYICNYEAFLATEYKKFLAAKENA